MTRHILAWYIAACATLVLVVQGLSAVRAVALGPLLLAVGAVALAWLAIARPRLALRRRPFAVPAYLIHPSTLPFLLVLPIIAGISFALGWHMPPNNWDSMTYHLSRAAYWRQWHTLAHFPTNNWRQDAFPGNAEVLLLVTLLVANSAKLAFIVQFAAYIAATVAVYGLGRQLQVKPAYALIGAGAFATMPEVVLQSTSAQNDLTVAAFIVCAIYFFVDALQGRRTSSIVLMGAALGLAIGTKPTSILALPGLAIGAAILLWQYRRGLALPTRKRALVTSAIVSVAVAVLLGAPWYIANKAYYGNMSGPAVVASTQQVDHPSAQTLRANLVRYLVAFIDPEGPALLSPKTAAAVCANTANLRANLVEATHNPLYMPQIEWAGVGYSSAPTCSYNEDLSWFGLAGWLAVAIGLAWAMAGPPARRLGLAWLLAMGMASFLVCASLLLRWTPWQGRLVITAVALGSPLLSIAAERCSRRLIGRLALQLTLFYATITGLETAVNNAAKPLAAWDVSRSAMQVATRPEMGPIVDEVMQAVPPNEQMGVFLGVDDWDFPLFGTQLDRKIEPLVLSNMPQSYPTSPTKLPFIVTHQTTKEVLFLLNKLHLNCRFVRTIDTTHTTTTWKIYHCADAKLLSHQSAPKGVADDADPAVR